MFRFEKEGDLRELLNKVDDFESKISILLSRIQNEGGEGALRILRENTPVVTGELLASLTLIRGERIFEITMVDYGKYVEERIGFISAIEPTLNNFLQNLVDRLTEEEFSE